MTNEVLGEATIIPLKGNPCSCSFRASKEDEEIFETDKFSLSFGKIEIVKKDRTVIPKGWGLNFVNYKGTPDKAFVFNYCPWCGGRLSE